MGVMGRLSREALRGKDPSKQIFPLSFEEEGEKGREVDKY